MPSVMAIVSKAVFEREAHGLDVGDLWVTDNYASKGKALEALADGGDLYLVTVRPPERLCLVAILRAPRATKTGWQAEANDVRIRNIDALRSQIKFVSGVGITAKAGALGMSLQTPRVLSDEDVALLSSDAPVAKPAAKAVPPVVRKRTVEPKPPEPKKTSAPRTAKASAKASAREVSTALAHATEGEWPEALAILLDVWRMAPHRDLANAIVAIGAAAPKREVGNWLAQARKQAPETLDALLAVIFDKGSVEARPRVDALVAWPADPRIDRWVAGLFEKPVYTSTGARPLWTKIQPLTKRIVDGPAIETIAKARKGNWKHVDFTTDFLADYVDRAKLVAQPEAALSAADTSALAEIGTLLGAKQAKPVSGKRADELLAQFLANPADDAVRVVLGDALIEAEDPRGELIALQLGPPSAAATKRVHEIIDSARAQLLGPLDGAVTSDVTFTKGFLSHAALKRNTKPMVGHAIAASVGHPLWVTVEHLEGPGDAEITRHPVMRSLRSLRASDVPLAELAKLERLDTLACDHVDTAAVDVLLGDGFASLVSLDLDLEPYAASSVELVRRVVMAPKLADLAALQLRIGLAYFTGYAERIAMEAAQSAAIHALFALVPKVKCPDVTLRLVRSTDKDISSVFRLVRDGGKLAVTIAVMPMNRHQEPYAEADILLALDAIAKLSPASVVLEKPPRTPVVREAIEARIARF